jgi:hypothetical protein
MACFSLPKLRNLTCGLYYKHITIVNYNSSIVNKFGASLTDDARVVIYNCHMFIVQATAYLSSMFTYSSNLTSYMTLGFFSA